MRASIIFLCAGVFNIYCAIDTRHAWFFMPMAAISFLLGGIAIASRK